jgi:hypothetical protein
MLIDVEVLVHYVHVSRPGPLNTSLPIRPAIINCVHKKSP